ncbi:glutamine synthetase family protein [Entomomonas sp. E2T0]|uniref:glutamine synthetase family protein n=1 Tax=Entomomonas sp. E2T0 TaxID=2930213 RepID=UPI00222850CD|nr:glutamine synthetase family protein [Entomomonas sp. E2T0]UYZ84040.1 glutamine synthetase family protein [Entomomonas sp. E2T0]
MAIVSEILQQKLANVKEVACVIADINGIPRGKMMSKDGFLSGRRLQMARGILLQCIMGGYPPTHFYGADDGDVAVYPDEQHIYLLPWSDIPKALVLSDAYELNGEPSNLCSRVLLKRILQRYSDLQFEPVVATEIEFFLFDKNSDPKESFMPPIGLDGRRETGAAGFTVSANNNLQPFFQELYQSMESFGIPRDTFEHEMGTSQFELNLVHDNALLIADQTLLFKFMVKELALKYGMIAVFMAKPVEGVAGSSMHIHQSIVNKETGNNIFNDESGEATPEFFNYIGGLQTVLGDLTPFYAPNINSFQRLNNPYYSPNNVCWSYDNRAAGLRIPVSSPEARRIENRLAGVDVNPYLAIAATLAAGLYGLENKCQPTEPSSGEIIVPDELTVPNSLFGALQRLEKSKLAHGLFNQEFIDGFIATKRQELQSFFEEISPWERLYLGGQL